MNNYDRLKNYRYSLKWNSYSAWSAKSYSLNPNLCKIINDRFLNEISHFRRVNRRDLFSTINMSMFLSTVKYRRWSDRHRKLLRSITLYSHCGRMLIIAAGCIKKKRKKKEQKWKNTLRPAARRIRFLQPDSITLCIN